MQTLILDVKVLIASYDEKIWYYFYRYDDEFKKYTCTSNGKKTFIDLFTVCVTEKNDDYQCDKFYLFNKLHHNTLPAIIYVGKWGANIKNNKFNIEINKIRSNNNCPFHYQIWYYWGKVHNTNMLLPSIIADDFQAWYCKGKIHRVLSPAIIYHNGKQVWYHRGNIHRIDDLPAIIDKNDKEWYYNGKRHRDNDKPAVMSGCSLEWWYHGKNHRENDLPSLIHDNIKEWYYQGKCHRSNDLPAIMYKSGTNMWYYNGKQHRDNNLPAVIFFDGEQEWWVNGKKIIH